MGHTNQGEDRGGRGREAVPANSIACDRPTARQLPSSETEQTRAEEERRGGDRRTEGAKESLGIESTQHI